MSIVNPSFFGIVDLRTIVAFVIVTAAAIIAERLITRYLSKVGDHLKLEPHVTNNLALIFRIIILIIAVAIIVSIGRLPTEWILSISAIGGAALGFASQKTIGNFIAGLFLLGARPFRVGDYVRIGSVEGIVQEITINYTKVFTAANSTISVSNLQILDRDITNYSYKLETMGKETEIYCYTFEMGFDHSVNTEKISAIFEEVCRNLLPELPKKPNYTLIRSGGIERVYLVYLYVRNPEDIFIFRANLASEVFRRWDQARAKT